MLSCRPAEVVTTKLIELRLVKQQTEGSLLWSVVVETEAHSQEGPACHGYRRRSTSNETLFGEPGRFHVYVSYGIQHCVNVVADRTDWSNSVLLRAVALPDEPERIAAGPSLLARDVGLNLREDSSLITGEHEIYHGLKHCKHKVVNGS